MCDSDVFISVQIGDRIQKIRRSGQGSVIDEGITRHLTLVGGIHPSFVSGELVQTHLIVNGTGGIVVGLGNDKASDLSPLLEIRGGIEDSVHV